MSRTCLALALLLAGVTGCGQDEGTVCTAVYAYGLSVVVQDAATGALILAGITVTAEDGSYHETLQSVVGAHFFGAGERAGTYTVRVAGEGFVTAELHDIVVTRDACHVHGVSQTVLLHHTP